MRTGLFFSPQDYWKVMLRIALPNKGRLSDDTRELFADAGLEVRSQSDRALTASVGVQFHPEKSSDAGVRFVHAFLDEVRR